MKPIDIILLRIKGEVLWTVQLVHCAIFGNGNTKCGVHIIDEADRKLGIVHFYVARCITIRRYTIFNCKCPGTSLLVYSFASAKP